METSLKRKNELTISSILSETDLHSLENAESGSKFILYLSLIFYNK